MSKPTLLISNYHLDYTGGGTYVMMILNILKRYYTIFSDNNINYYHDQHTPFRFERGEIQPDSPTQIYDVHLFAHYRGWIPPRGKFNAQILYYPIQKEVTGWNNFFVLNEFCSKAANVYSGVNHIITPYYDANQFYVSDKTVDLINIGHYFIEHDGHSKNQHLIMNWFKTKPQFNKIIFHGALSNSNFYSYLQNLAADDPRIVLKHNRTQQEIKQDLASAKYMVHANGYRRTAPEQNEHFGLVAVEALLSGCQPIVHKSGGCPDIPGVLSYNEFDDMVFGTTNPTELRKFGMLFNKENTENQLKDALNL